MNELLFKAGLFDAHAVRAEEAVGRDRILEGDIACLFGWRAGHVGAERCWYDPAGHIQAVPPRFTQRSHTIEAHLPCGHKQWAMGTHGGGNRPWACVTGDDGNDYTGHGATPELSLLAAMLRSRAACLRAAAAVEPVREILVRLSGLNDEQVTDDARLHEDLDLDSLDRVQVAVDLELHYNIEIPDSDVDDPALGTVGGLKAYMARRLAE